ncbi:MAG: bifunctional (p)ppGpp synthetase/guanosine-3',5'-bis(diphosphate) 3'-pyrophosphohydrolase [Lentimicrobiaceae bacterium]|jgi:GTP pyrophosphokinase|nr:bifunctional (p)ppGpp synthetase/guanosine-3',5'-bis(diphosphate) 3'-pyrophosphohydrolase [Lentimicrobiaceae bacterium]MDD4596783.1 bifunctional (p)ppGpp synthetase/guanosine-3',5'-bis(diphosphate) 3'-pyrophosphohydrolase [Lentimicrobiaceae bacterium]
MDMIETAVNYVIDPDEERKEILKRYRNLLSAWGKASESKNKRLVRKAFNLAVTAHKDMRRKSGEPYIYHPLEVARIVAGEIGLGETSIIGALLHDVVEDTDYTIDDIRRMFGDKIASIIDGLTKIKEIFDHTSSSSQQAENFRKILLTLSDDVRVILIKLADRLHNMRTLDAMTGEKQLKIASETIYLFAPLAHRLGLYAIKTELEDLALKYTEPEVYYTITSKLAESEVSRTRFINKFIYPIKKALAEQGLKVQIIGREKSIYSIWNKMKAKQIPFEEVFDLFAVRIVIDAPLESEKYLCWQAYSIVTDFYNPKQNRLRDWISNPKANGYESLHTTVMSHTGQWVEVQIRSKRMNEIAEKGYAAHWKYKEKVNSESGIDQWLNKINELLQQPDSNALAFLDEFKLNLFADEIIVFTPKGEIKTLPAKSTALDFAYSIHSEIGNQSIGAKVNHRLVSLNHRLNNGDQVEMITSKKQTPKPEWMDYAVTARARSVIKEAIKEQRRKFTEEGKRMLEGYFKELNVEFSRHHLLRLQECNQIASTIDLYYKVVHGEIGLKELKECMHQHDKGNWLNIITRPFTRSRANVPHSLGDDMREKMQKKKGAEVRQEDETGYRISECCNPIPGDEVIGFTGQDASIWVHRTNCPEAIQLMSKYGNRIVKTKWQSREASDFITTIHISGFDKQGLIADVVQIITVTMNLNMRSFHIDSTGEVFEANIKVMVSDTSQLNHLMAEIRKLNGIEVVYRLNSAPDKQV